MYKTRKIYFLKDTGEVVWDVSYSSYKDVNFERDYELSSTLKQYEKTALDVLVLTDGQYAQDFAECNGYRVNPETKELEFSYPDPNEPEPQEPVYQKPLTEQLKETQQAVAELTLLLSTLNGGM